MHPNPPSLLESFSALKDYLIASNVLLTALPVLASYVFPRYLYESATVLSLSSPLSYAISYDGLIFLENRYLWEVNFAFLPGFTFVVRIIGLAAALLSNDNPTVVILMVILLNKLLTAFAALNLYQLAWGYGGKSLAQAAAVLFLFNPSSVFYHSVYSEPLFAFLTILAIKKALKDRKKSTSLIVNPISFICHHGWSLALFAAAITVRSTGLFLSLLLGIPILAQLWAGLLQSLKATIATIATGALVLGCFLTPFLLYLCYGYYQFCSGTAHPSQFCSNSPPNIYAYVEDKFWEVGFLKYYFTGQPFQVVFGLMTVTVGLTTLIVTVRSRRSLFGDLYSQGLIAALVIVALVTTLYANVQSGTRFFSTHPLFYITCGYCLLRTKNTRKFAFIQKLLIGYFILFNIAGCLWFPLRFNWA